MNTIKWPNAIAGAIVLGVFVYAVFWLYVHRDVWHKHEVKTEIVSLAPLKSPQPKPVLAKPQKPIYRAVKHGGALDGQVGCKRVEGFRQYPYSLVQQYAGQYGIPPAVVEKYRVCFQQ